MADIHSWLAELGLEKYNSAFAEAEINYETLPDFLEEDLKELGLPLGPRRRVWGAILRLGKADRFAILRAPHNVVVFMLSVVENYSG